MVPSARIFLLFLKYRLLLEAQFKLPVFTLADM